MEKTSLSTPGAVRKAVRAIIEGKLVVVQFANNFGYLANPANERAVANILKAKNDSNTMKSFSALLPTHIFSKSIHYKKIPNHLHKILRNAKHLEELLGMMCHLRAPVTTSAAKSLPSRIVSNNDGTAHVQNFFIKGNAGIEKIRDALFREKKMYLSVTTLNQHGKPEITTVTEAEAEASNMGVSLLLTDEPKRLEVKGSWPIIDIARLSTIRHGCIPITTIAHILKANISTEEAIQTNYTQDVAFLTFLKDVEELNTHPKKVRQIILAYLNGAAAHEVMK
jgi:tRNA A37 threonylcarbamoyladenosine synthetase subunit TsaC/SUA5/YrdC